MNWDNNEQNNMNGYNPFVNSDPNYNQYEQPAQPIQSYEPSYVATTEANFNPYEQPVQNYGAANMGTPNTNHLEQTHHSSQVDNLSSSNQSSMQSSGGSFWQSFGLLSALQNLNQQTQNQNLAAQENQSRLKQQALQQELDSQQEQSQTAIIELQGENARLRKEIAKLNNLLKQPSNIIAQYHQGFSETYIKDKEILANWMVWQKAFQEIAIQLGSELGLSQQEVIEKAKANYSLVLTNSNEPSHDTNSTDNFFNPFREKLLEKFAPKTKEEVADRIKKTTQAFNESNNTTNSSPNKQPQA